jgi:tRNA threonylcarbamoyladenosine biosynthesis protein TsaB
MNPEQAKLLILETSGRVGQVAVAQGPELRASRQLAESRRHARDLAPAVAELLAGQGWTPRAVQAVVVSRGPGSYTGLRVGIMSAKAFAYATGCALLALDTFAAIALQAPKEALLLDVLADAQQDRVYVQRFARDEVSAEWQPKSPLSIQMLGDWQAQLDALTWVTGPGLHAYGERLRAGTPIVRSADWDPRLESVLKIGYARLRAGERGDLWTVEPLYLRPSAAEEKWLARTP